MLGALVYSDYLHLFKNKKIIASNNFESQIQPSSIDLSISDECYEIQASFLSPNEKVRNKLKKFSIRKIDLNRPKILKKRQNIYH